MKIVKENDKGKAVCQKCGLTSTTYLLRNIEFSDKSGVVNDLLAAVCDNCNEVVSVPRQSIPQIRDEYNKTRKPIEARIPAHFSDILRLATYKIDARLSEDFSKYLIFYYIHSLNEGRGSWDNVKELLLSDVASAPSSKRLSLKVNKRIEEEFESAIKKSGLRSNSELIKGIILKINEDIVQPAKPTNIRELKRFASVVGWV